MSHVVSFSSNDVLYTTHFLGNRETRMGQ